MHQLAYNTAPYMADSRSASPHVPLASANGAPFVRALVLAFLAYSLLAAVAAWPLLRDSGTHIASDAGDPILNTSIVVWNAKTLPYTQAWWTAPHFHPATDTTTFTENLLGVYPLSSPIYWLTGNGLLAYNLPLFLTWPLAGTSMFLLVWLLTRRHDAAFLAGLAFAFTPYRGVALAHMQTVATFGVPLALAGLHGYLESGRRRWLVLFALAWAQTGLANGYYILYGGLAFSWWLLYFCSTQDRFRRVPPVLVAWFVGSIPIFPILWHYRSVHNALGLHRSLFEILYFSASPGSWFEVGDSVWFWRHVLPNGKDNMFPGLTAIVVALAGVLLALQRASVADRDMASANVRRLRYGLTGVFAIAAVAIGINLVYGPLDVMLGPVPLKIRSLDRAVVLLLLSGIPLLLLWRPTLEALRRRSVTVWYVVGVVIFGLLACGPNLRVAGQSIWNPTPYGWLMHLPGFNELRVPTQIKMIQLVCITTAMGLGIAVLAPRRNRAALALAGVVVLGVGLDGWLADVPMADAPVPWPVAEPASRAVPILELPLGPPWDAAATYRAALSGRRVVNGVSGYDPPYYEALKAGLTGHDIATLTALATFGAYDIVVDGTADPDGAYAAYAASAPGASLVITDGPRRVYSVPRAERPAVPSGPAIPVKGMQGVRHAGDLPLLHDGRLDTMWADNPQEPDEWLIADLGEQHEVAGVTDALFDAGREFPYHVVVDTSVDGEHWDSAWDGAGFAPALLSLADTPLDARVAVSFEPRAARYVRVRQVAKATTRWRVAELVVHGPAPR